MITNLEKWLLINESYEIVKEFANYKEAKNYIKQNGGEIISKSYFETYYK